MNGLELVERVGSEATTNGFELVERVGHGATGDVWKANKDGEEFVLKFFSKHDASISWSFI